MNATQTLTGSRRSARSSASTARMRSPKSFALSRIRNGRAAGNLMKVYLLTAWKLNSANFALTEFLGSSPDTRLDSGSGIMLQGGKK
jgi:hypothetical protein